MPQVRNMFGHWVMRHSDNSSLVLNLHSNISYSKTHLTSCIMCLQEMLTTCKTQNTWYALKYLEIPTRVFIIITMEILHDKTQFFFRFATYIHVYYSPNVYLKTCSSGKNRVRLTLRENNMTIKRLSQQIAEHYNISTFSSYFDIVHVVL